MSNINPNLDSEEKEQVEEHQHLRSRVVFEIVRSDGNTQLSRPSISLWWSGLAAGVAMGFSVLAEAVIRSGLSNEPFRHLIENFGYCVGFLIVILSRQQLFTENTITPILPLMTERTSQKFLRVSRLWAIVFAANVAGTFLFASFFYFAPVLNSPTIQSMLEISHHMMQNSWWEMLAKGVVSGWLIAALVWILPASEGFEFLVITLITYLIAVGDFTHIIAGSVEAFLLVFASKLSLIDMIWNFMAPVFLGNVVGGTVLFSLVAYGQVKEEI